MKRSSSQVTNTDEHIQVRATRPRVEDEDNSPPAVVFERERTPYRRNRLPTPPESPSQRPFIPGYVPMKFPSFEEIMRPVAEFRRFLPAIKYPTNVSYKVATDSKVTCGICLTNEPTCALVPCGHSNYCSCVIQWVRTHRTCPHCKASVEQVMRLFP